MRSIQVGAWDKMMNNVLNFYYGYLRVHNTEYWEDKSINNSFYRSDDLSKLINESEKVQFAVPRLESFALVANEDKTAIVMFVGTDTELESRQSGIKDKIIEGEFLTNKDDIVIGEGLAEKLNSSVGDTLVFIGQGFRGANAVGKYRVGGVVKIGSPDLNKIMVYSSLSVAQEFYATEGRITSLTLYIESKEDIELVQESFANLDTSKFQLMEFNEMMPELVEAKKFDTISNNVIFIILYMIITFGIFGTILMMTKERRYEFGVLVAIGMSKLRLATIIWLEIVFLGFVGVLGGVLLSFPLVIYFNRVPIDVSNLSPESADVYDKFGFEPIFPAAIDLNIFLSQGLVVFIIASFLAFFPIWKIIHF
jgi:ABC-type lipoprotein release transport system permease subunit